ncbi:hypothetical protein LUZ60_013381 [Juncus effusus]|nr:hypothetical protein LUZ60_013381 [Juncus effusus]
MELKNVSSCYNDPFALLSLLKASTKSPSLTSGTQIHSIILKLGFNSNPFLATALIKMYSQSGTSTDAHKVFNEMPKRTAVSWTALISTYEQNGYPKRALDLFREMQLDNVKPDRVSITVAISACTDLNALDLGGWIYAYICRNWNKYEILEDLVLQNALINMYVKCGDIKSAKYLFDMAKRRDVTTWTCMIMGHALHGHAIEALNLFNIMKLQTKPNHVTFLGVLMACNHAGLFKDTWKYFKSMERDFGIKPKITHYGCMVDMLCRLGLIEEAYEFINKMPIKANDTIWRTFLYACSVKGNITLASLARARLAELAPHHAGDDVAMSNAYANLGFWEEKVRVRARVKRRKPPGCSLIEVESQTREFTISDGAKCKNDELKEVIEGLTANSKSLEGSFENFEFCYYDLVGE